jgi:glycosyltransferase involved in cell wall biosynthesis
MHRLVSVVIPVRNGAKYLGEAIHSVLVSDLRQGHADLEVIVVDNASTDASRVLAESFGSPVRVIAEPQPGAANARNSGVNLAQGDYLAFLDADDLWAPTKLQRQLDELEASPDLDLVFTHGENFLSPELTPAQRNVVVCDPEITPFILPSAMLARRQSFLRVGPLPNLREGEFIAWYGLALSMGIRSHIIPEPLLRRRVHLSNSTRLQSHPSDLLRAAKIVLDSKKQSKVIPC